MFILSACSKHRMQKSSADDGLSSSLPKVSEDWDLLTAHEYFCFEHHFVRRLRGLRIESSQLVGLRRLPVVKHLVYERLPVLKHFVFNNELLSSCQNPIAMDSRKGGFRPDKYFKALSYILSWSPSSAHFMKAGWGVS